MSSFDSGRSGSFLNYCDANFAPGSAETGHSRYYQAALKALIDAPDIRKNRIADVKCKIESGSFDLSAEDIAGRLLALFDECII